MSFKPLTLALIVAALLGPHAVHAQATANTTPSERCTSLSRTDFSQVQDAPTQILKSRIEAAAGAELGYCEVSGYVTPTINFLLRLPTETWNGKFIELGC